MSTFANRTSWQMLIDGEQVDALNGGRFDAVDPSTGATWASLPAADADDVDRAVSARGGPLRAQSGVP